MTTIFFLKQAAVVAMKLTSEICFVFKIAGAVCQASLLIDLHAVSGEFRVKLTQLAGS